MIPSAGKKITPYLPYPLLKKTFPHIIATTPSMK
jgi:hypothetical protein